MSLVKNERTPRMMSEARFETGYPQVFDPSAKPFPWWAVGLSFFVGWCVAWWVLTL